ncbi:hypothetical protein G9A89_004216 [Geosiphon pyriformis]|nr:hypothetical protein G9A89_004216 [Geosiphon pyriformis]
MTDFGLTDNYCVHDDLDQVCGYKINSHFISKSDHTESRAGFSLFFAAGAFVDNTIWVGSSQNATQHILNIASDFFWINDISINNKKTVAIPINSKISNPSLFISGSFITIAKKGESHQYLDIFFLTENFSKPSLAKTYSDVRFFTNQVLRKANALIHKGLKLKSSLPLDFPSDTIHHSSFYGLKSFLQIQSESKIASLVGFVNSGGILGRLFSYQSHDLKIQCWHSVHSLVSPVYTHFCDGMPMSAVLDKLKFIKFLPSLQLDPCGSVPNWFKLSTAFLNSVSASSICLMALCGTGPLNILEFSDCVSICDHLSQVDTSMLFVYTDRSLKNFGTVNCSTSATVFFEDIGLSLGVGFDVFYTGRITGYCTGFEIKRQHIFNVICNKNLKISWHKMKDHSGVLGNECADVITNTASLSDWCLPPCVDERFIMADAYARTYFMKTLHYHLPVAVWKCLYNRLYPSILCLYCGKVEVSDHAFSCRVDESARRQLLDFHMDSWKILSGSNHASSCMLQLLSSCASNSSVYMALFKSFVFDSWFWETISVFCDSKLAGLKIVKFVHSLSLAFKDNVWLVRAKHCVYIKKAWFDPS